MVDLTQAGVVLALVGIGMMAASVASGRSESRGEVKGAGIVMIGPIPIVFGSDGRWASIAIVLAIILIALSLFAMVV
jgi:uncharacterized protein (TIGR00304 family)